MMRPVLTSSPALLRSRQCTTAWWVGANVPLRCTLITASQSASVMLPDRGVAGDAGVVDEDVEPAELVDGLLHHAPGAFEVGDVLVVRGRLAAALANEIDGEVGVLAGALALEAGAEIVDEDLGALLGQLERVTAADAVARAGHDRHPAVEQTHVASEIPVFWPAVRF